jgi:hypothetical protein
VGVGVGGGAKLSLPSVENYAKMTTYFSFAFCDYNVIFLGCVMHHWKGVFKTFPTVYYKPPNSKISTGKTKEILQSFSDCSAGWSK